VWFVKDENGIVTLPLKPCRYHPMMRWRWVCSSAAEIGFVSMSAGCFDVFIALILIEPSFTKLLK
jgi:hypothetical protein